MFGIQDKGVNIYYIILSCVLEELTYSMEQGPS